jgi:hypothetical protein
MNTSRTEKIERFKAKNKLKKDIEVIKLYLNILFRLIYKFKIFRLIFYKFNILGIKKRKK